MSLLLPATPSPTFPHQSNLHRAIAFHAPLRLQPLKRIISASLPSQSLLAAKLTGTSLHLLKEFSNGKWQEYAVGFVPVSLAVGVCHQLGIGMEREIQVAVLRSFIQLLTLGLVLKFIFEGQHFLWSTAGIAAMVLLAGHTAGGQAKQLPRSRILATLSLAFGTLGTIGLMVLLQVFPAELSAVIPFTGHVLGNAMIMVGGTLKTLQYEISQHRGKIEAALALGSTPRCAVESHIQRSFTIGMAPMVDAIKVMGLVSLPGNMTGLLMGGALPLEAIKVQIKIINVVLGASAISCLISTLLGWRMLFAHTNQLKDV